MSYERPGEIFRWSDVDRLISILERMQHPGCEIPPWQLLSEPENGVRYIQTPNYPEEFTELWRYLYESSLYIDPYNRLPEDPRDKRGMFHRWAGGLPNHWYESSSLGQTRRYLIWITRGERFCNGLLAAEFTEGAMLTALHPMRQLRREQLKGDQMRVNLKELADYADRYDRDYDRPMELIVPDVTRVGSLELSELETLVRWKSPRAITKARKNEE